MIVSDSLFYGLGLPGTAAALAARALRRAEAHHPDPTQFQASGGLDHMIVGLLSGTALIAFGLLAAASTGLLLPLALIATVTMLRAVDFGPRLIAFYRYQTLLAAASLAAAILLLIATINTLQGASNV